MRRLAASLALLVALVCAAPAAAMQHEHAPEVRNATPATQGFLYAAIAEADAWWTARGYTLPPARVFIYDEQNPETGLLPLAQATIGGSSVYFERRYVAKVEQEMQNGNMRFALRWVCRIAVHERGHNLGFLHENFPDWMPLEQQHVMVGVTSRLRRCGGWAKAMHQKYVIDAHPAAGLTPAIHP